MINFDSFLIPKDLHIMLKLVERAEYNTYEVTIGTSILDWKGLPFQMD